MLSNKVRKRSENNITRERYRMMKKLSICIYVPTKSLYRLREYVHICSNM